MHACIIIRHGLGLGLPMGWFGLGQTVILPMFKL